jgi:AraC-like DNA-binding protein
MQALMATITLDWLHIVALLGAVQGLILAGVLAVRRRNRTANRILAVAICAFTIYLATSVYHAAGLETAFPHFFGWAHPMPLLFGPLIYLYAVSASDRSRRFTRRDWIHFVPAALAVIAALPVYLLSGPEKIAWYQNTLRSGEVPLIVQVFTPLKLISGVTYTVMTLLFVRRHRARIMANYSSLERVNLQWLVRLSAAIWVVAVLVNVVQMFEGPASQRGEDLITIGIALIVYGIGYMALRQAEIYRFDTGEYPVVATPAATAPPGDSPQAGPPPAPAPKPVVTAEEVGARYERSGLSDREAAALKGALLNSMERDRPWQNSELTLADLARRLSTTPHKLSEVLNSELDQTFYDFVNSYRVRYVQSRIGGRDAQNLKILSLALDAGFASKSTFNDVFKKHTGQTPSHYRRSAAV